MLLHTWRIQPVKLISHNCRENIANTLVASDFKDPPTVSEEPLYIVRRLTPTECARLQGFPDWWCSGLETEKTTDEEIDFWRNVFNTYAEINGKKPKTDKQIIKWLKNPHTDSAEYKMWGNGVALPCVVLYFHALSVLHKKMKKLLIVLDFRILIFLHFRVIYILLNRGGNIYEISKQRNG